MCVGRCRRLFIVRAVVVDREVLLLRSPLRGSLRPVLWEGEEFVGFEKGHAPKRKKEVKLQERRKGGGETEASERREGGGETERRGGAIGFS